MKWIFSILLVGLVSIAPFASAHADTADIRCENPALIVDVGQGNNARLVQAMLRRSDAVQAQLNEMATAADLSDVRTLLIGVGASTKGLGAAGLDVGEERGRMEALLAAAKENDITVVGIHIGGESRRGELSDGFIERVAELSDVFVVWGEGNEDGFFDQLAARYNVPMHLVERRLEISAKIESLFQP